MFGADFGLLHMVAVAPTPADEEQRLVALHDYAILDTPSDSRFDLFPQICSWVYDLPIAAINLVDAERTFFKSLAGITPYQPRRATSICAHAVGEGNPIMVIEDLTTDPRFHDHPLVLKGLAFYAGALLRSPSGHALGTLCVAGTRPRRFTGEDRSKLLELARGVSTVLELHRSSSLLLRIADQDMLTGLSTRRAFMRCLEAATRLAAAGRPCALLYLDLDRFKIVNDTLGHAAGDALLSEVGRRLAGSVRATDKVARLGGDEFAILTEDHAAPGSAEALAQRILDNFANTFIFNQADLPIRTSIGIATTVHAVPEDAQTLMRWADEALYVAKRAGRSRFAVYDQRGMSAAACRA